MSPRPVPLTPRERDVLALMAEGRSNPAIGRALVVSHKAVEKHVSNIFTKLDLLPAPDDHRRVLAVLRWVDERAVRRNPAPAPIPKGASGCRHGPDRADPDGQVA